MMKWNEMENFGKKEQETQEEIEPGLPPVTIDTLSPTMKAAADQVGWGSLTPVQQHGIPYMLAGRDLLAQAKTGSGKTGAFILPLMEKINFKKKACQALVLVPTRELAQQVTADAKALAGKSDFGVVAVYGGSSYKPQIDAFKKGTHLVVGTPGRILDHLIKRNLKLDQLDYLIFDEADRMMSMGFYPDMVRVQEFLPRRKIHTSMFSATFPAQVIRLTQQFLNDPYLLRLSVDQVHVEDTEHIYYRVPGMEKDRILVRIIEQENPNQTIVFCNTKDKVFYVTRVLQRFGYNADQISSDLSQNKRDEVLRRVRSGKLRFLVATDVAARGIDIPDLTHVIQYEPPDDHEAYIHRAGRTGRAGASGTAILLTDYNEEKMLKRIAARYKIEFEQREAPLVEEVEALVAQRLVAQLEARLRDRDRLKIERMQRFVPLAQQLAGGEHGLALLAMLLDDEYHDWMHHPPELPPIGTTAKRKESSKKKRYSGSSKRRSKSGGKQGGRKRR
ncbi:MAG: DEAD/DEAH box helicase [Chloroflexota bacterium]